VHFFSLCRQILKKFDPKMGDILDFYIFSGEKNSSKFKHVAEKMAKL